MKTICLFSDGSCLKNPGNGGWAYILEWDKYKKISSGGEANTTNNKMELRAVIEGLKAIKQECNVEIYTDSTYVANGINIWLKNWIKKDFKNVKNPELWKELLALLKKHSVKAIWIRGHNGHKQNEECDKLAKQAALEVENKANATKEK